MNLLSGYPSFPRMFLLTRPSACDLQDLPMKNAGKPGWPLSPRRPWIRPWIGRGFFSLKDPFCGAQTWAVWCRVQHLLRLACCSKKLVALNGWIVTLKQWIRVDNLGKNIACFRAAKVDVICFQVVYHQHWICDINWSVCFLWSIWTPMTPTLWFPHNSYNRIKMNQVHHPRFPCSLGNLKKQRKHNFHPISPGLVLELTVYPHHVSVNWKSDPVM